MQAATTLIAWTPPDQAMASREDWKATAGTVRLVAWPDVEGATAAYACLDGACSPRWRRLAHLELVAQLFIVYAKMVLRGMNPIATHLALMGLDEYRDNLPPELAAGLEEAKACAPVIRLADYRPALPVPKAG